MRLRLRAPGGQSALALPDDATVGDLIAQVIEKTEISEFDIKYGYPPKPFLLEQYERSLPLAQLDLDLNGETLILSPKESKHDTKPSTPSQAANVAASSTKEPTSVSFAGLSGSSVQKDVGPISLKKRAMEGDVPELPLSDRRATLGMSQALFIDGLC